MQRWMNIPVPCFVFAACNDQIVPISNSLAFLQALAQHGVTFESHIYAYGHMDFLQGTPLFSCKDTDVQSYSKLGRG